CRSSPTIWNDNPLLLRKTVTGFPSLRFYAFSKQIVCAKPYLKSFMTEAGIDAKRNFSFRSESHAKTHITLGVAPIPLRPAIEDSSRVTECDQTCGRSYVPAVLRIDENGVVTVEAESTVTTKRLRAAQCRLQIERNDLSIVGSRQRCRPVQ